MIDSVKGHGREPLEITRVALRFPSTAQVFGRGVPIDPGAPRWVLPGDRSPDEQEQAAWADLSLKSLQRWFDENE